jgi:hypothetical protein
MSPWNYSMNEMKEGKLFMIIRIWRTEIAHAMRNELEGTLSCVLEAQDMSSLRE